jgi:hypothetical protein
MDAKEKAEELFNKYATYVVMWTGGSEVERQNCKQCAKIAVDEIILQNNVWIKQIGKGTNNYWIEVKEEIEKL